MDSRFNDILDLPENNIFRVVFYPDRIYHAQHLEATRSPRYRYNVMEVRTQADITVMKGEVYRDELLLGTFLRIEGESEVILKREEITLRGNGTIGFGHSALEQGIDLMRFEVLG